MANTHGFQVVAGASIKLLREFLRAAWKSGGKKLGEAIDPGTIPESLDLPAGTAFGSFVLTDGNIQIPKDQLDITLVANMGVDIKVGLKGQAHLQNAQNLAVPSLSLQDITADVHIFAPIGPLVGPDHVPNEVGVQLKTAPKPTVTLTGPDPASHLDQLIAEQVRTLAGSAPALPTERGVTVLYHATPAYTVSELLEILNDSSHQIHVVQLPGTPPQLQVTLPVHFSMYSVVQKPATDPPPPLFEPFVVEARVVVTALLIDDTTSPGGFQVRFSAPTTTVTVDSVIPRGLTGNFIGNKTRLGSEFDAIVDSHITRQGRNYLAQLGDIAISIPTVASIQDALATFIQTQLAAMNFISIWPPKDTAGLPLTIADVSVKVLSDALLLAINKGTTGDVNALTNFIPPSRDLAFVMSAAGVDAIFEDIKRKDNPFHRYEGDDHEFDLKTLSISLKTGALHFDGSMTVIDAIAGSIDVDASFSTDIHLAWKNDAIEAKADTPDVDTDLSILAWVVSLIIGFITAGSWGLIIAIIVNKVAEAVAANMGTDIVKDPDFTAVAAWPAELPKIGKVDAHFDNPIDISPDGLMFSAMVAP